MFIMLLFFTQFIQYPEMYFRNLAALSLIAMLLGFNIVFNTHFYVDTKLKEDFNKQLKTH